MKMESSLGGWCVLRTLTGFIEVKIKFIYWVSGKYTKINRRSLRL